jgi:hypothetical protein
MDSLCARARAAMNLILIAGILQAWVILSDRPTLSDYVDQVCETLANVSPRTLDPKSFGNLMDGLNAYESSVENRLIKSQRLKCPLEGKTMEEMRGT